MTDLDSALRTMLRERAADIDRLPVDFLHLPSLDVLDRDPIQDVRRGHRSTWLVAAAVITVLAVVASVIAIRNSGGGRPTPAATHTATPTTSPTPTPSGTTSSTAAGPHATRRVELAWFGMNQLPGYTQISRSSEPGYRVVTLRPDDDPGLPPGCNGCGTPPPTANILVFDRGRFDATKVTTGKRVPVQGRTGYLGQLTWYTVGVHKVASLAWEYGPDRWALVQGLTARTGTEDALLTMAAAVRPTMNSAIGLPFRLGYVPDLPITEVVDSFQYSFIVQFGDPAGRLFELSLTKQQSYAGAYDATSAKPQSIDGLPGYVNAAQADAGVRYHDGIATLGIGEASGKTTRADRSALTKVLANLHWVNHDGRAPLVPAEEAIP